MKRRSFSRKAKRSIPSKYILMVMTTLCIAAMLVSLIFNISGGPLQGIAGYVFIPMQTGINRIGTAISEQLEKFQTIEEVQEENEELQAQIDELTEELNTIRLEQYDLENYRELLELSEKYPDYEKVAANVIGKDTSNWFDTFLIDKGSDDGIEVDMNVISGGGLVGIVTSVGPNYAKVRSIIDDESTTSAMVLSTSDLCVVNGDLELMNSSQMLAFEKLSDDDDEVQVGDAVVTSNVSSKYLQGFLIGYISSIESDSTNLTKSGTITPVVDFQHLSEVLVILEVKDTSGMED